MGKKWAKTYMLQRIIGFIFRRRHYWRRVSFDEIAELYMSRLIMVFALNIFGLFIALYLLELGFTIPFIALMYAGLYVFKIILTPFAANYIAHFGPKHAILTANLLRIPSMVAIFMVADFGVWAVIVFGIFQQASSCLYNISYRVNFSKVRHVRHTGKELGVMEIIEKGAKIASPFIGGLLATYFGPEAVILVAGGLFIVSSFPLLQTVEPIRLGGKVSLSGFPWRSSYKSLIAEVGVGFDFVASGLSWTIFLAITFASLGSGIYTTVGALSSAGILAAMVTSWVFGRLVDRRRGDILFVAGVATME